MEAQTCPRGAFKLSPESWNLKHYLDGPPNKLLCVKILNSNTLNAREIVLTELAYGLTF